ncbi:MAG TPA: mechanosensitive ion channel family protein [Anaeromyxobacteraceae bacterium]|nr:mechanosensitive ion channel family protein [Anaeromyxobacteraceae bacterium]
MDRSPRARRTPGLVLLALAAPCVAAAGLEDRLPAPLLRPGPRGLLWWQWIALPAALVVALVLGWLLGWATRLLMARFARRTATSWDDLLVERIAGPLRALWTVAIATMLQPALALEGDAASVVHHLLRAAAYLALFWGAFRAINVAFVAMAAAPWTRANPGLSGLLPLGRKIAKIAVLAVGLIAVLNELGFQVASLLAGLGIGGLVLALAAQKTVENLFGSVSIGVDQPFRVGDYVRVEDVVGTVESIGIRSTRFRTLDRTIVTIPNGKLAEMKAETFAARDRIRLVANLGLGYDTTAEQMRQVLSAVESLLRAHPRVWPDGISVRFNELRESTLNVEVIAWFRTQDWNEFTAIRQDLYLAFMDAVAKAGARLAFPTREIVSRPARDRGGP